MNKPAHSDFLIHWTGEDIDKEYDPEWWNDKKSKLNKTIIAPYLERLKYILKYGLWMTKGNESITFQNKKIKRPAFARTCFTELKLSEAAMHAKKFGRLGIGFKRMFVLDRMGFPMVYYRPERDNWFITPCKRAGENKIDDYWACFLKSMDEEVVKGQLLQYSQFDESEWRIICSDEIVKDFHRMFKDPSDIEDPEFQAYIKKSDKNDKLEYLLPMQNARNGYSKWFAMIIYPSLAVKVAAEADKEIRQAIRSLKPLIKETDSPNSSAAYETFSQPFEINLQSCRHF